MSTHEEKLYDDIESEDGYDQGERKDPWRYRYYGPHALMAGLMCQFLKDGGNSVLEMGAAEAYLAVRVVKTATSLHVPGTDQVRYVYQYDGIELSHSAVDSGRHRVNRSSLGEVIKLQQGDVTDHDNWPDQQYDIVSVNNVLPYFPEEVRKGFLDNVFKRLVKKGGHLVLFTWVSSESGDSFHGSWPRWMVRADGRLRIDQPDYDGKNPMPYIYKYDVIRKPMDGETYTDSWAVLW